MRKNIPAIFVISTLVILILCSACVSSPSGDQKEGGLTQVTVPVQSSRISFEDAYQQLKEYRTDSVISSANDIRIYYILARDVDDSGNALSWIFGVNYGMGDRLLIYDKEGWTVFPNSTITLPSEEIKIDQIVSPNNLFTQNKGVMPSVSSSAIPERRDLELQQGSYHLNIYSGNNGRIIRFNATTGALIA